MDEITEIQPENTEEAPEEQLPVNDEAERLRKRVICLENGVRPEYAEDFSAIAERLSSGGEMDFEAAVRAAAEKYPLFTNDGRGVFRGGARCPQTGCGDIGDIIRSEQVKRRK